MIWHPEPTGPERAAESPADGGFERTVERVPETLGEDQPNLRGWQRLLVSSLALAAAIVLIALSPTTTTRTGSAIFAGTSLLLLTVSTIYHRSEWSNLTRDALRLDDQTNTLLLIAGSTTPARTPQRAPFPLPAETVTATTTAGITTVDALDWAFAGGLCELVKADGTSRVMAVHRWTREATCVDENLFTDRCNGPTLDVGCGPGRLTAAVTHRGFHALGIDISAEAVRQTRARGAAAVHQDVFAELPGSTAWQHILLADGNIGLGGDPVRLLIRLADLLTPGGSVLVEVAGPGIGTVHEHVRLRVGEQMSPPFSWATVGVDTIGAVADDAGLVLTRLDYESGRYVATLRHTKDRD